MYQVTSEEKQMLVPLFSGHKDSLILSCIQNYMGDAWVNEEKNPTSGMIILGDFCFLAGEVQKETLSYIEKAAKKRSLIVVADKKSWYEMLEQVYEGKTHRTHRYGIKKEGDIFDRKKLEQYTETLPEGYELLPIGKKEYESTLSAEWSADFCRQYKTWDDYKEKGFGVVILHQGEIVAGASTYSSYREGIEIEIVTREDYRRKGLALITGAKLVLEALERGLYPNWDAANMMSVGVAQKLGYHYDAPYEVCEVTFSDFLTPQSFS